MIRFTLLLALALAPSAIFAQEQVDISTMRLELPRGANPQVAYTNKRSAFFQTQALRNDHPEHAWFRGYNIAGKRLFQDVSVQIEGINLDPSKSKPTIIPDELERIYPNGLREQIRMYDNLDLLGLHYPNSRARPQIKLSGDDLVQVAPDLYESGTGENKLYVATLSNTGRAFIAIAPSSLAARELAFRATILSDTWTIERKARMENLLQGDHYFAADSQTEALRWMTLSLDALLTRQRGTGIYAGLPWFQEYWGRDQFIALPGATLVNGQFDSAKAILSSFARFQDTDPKSPFYGRLPNIVKPDELNYHTTDGTPRFVIALRDYVDYSGDFAFARELYPVVKASIEGSIQNHTDSSGYLTHADNETWMDARREPDKVSYSPRGNRANDIQALWIAQLEAGAAFASRMDDLDSHFKWDALASKVRQNFSRDFISNGQLADHLNADGTRDTQIRPNAFFALDLMRQPERARELQRLTSKLVHPWGVATLDSKDPQFLPYHLAPGKWHKDAAYHNGTVWPWLDGIAMQRLIESDRTAQAWQLFQFNSALAMRTNGSLPETMDALPHPREKLPRLTGTYSQAWSLAEQLRIWNQYFVGIRPHLIDGYVSLAPRLINPKHIVSTARIGSGYIRFHASPSELRYTFDNLLTRIRLDLPNYEATIVDVKPGDELVVRDNRGTVIRAGQPVHQFTLLPVARSKTEH